MLAICSSFVPPERWKRFATPSQPIMPAERADDVGVFGAVAGGDPDELAGFEPFLVVAGSGVDPAADQQAGRRARRHSGRRRSSTRAKLANGRINVQSVDLGQGGEEPARVADEPDALALVLRLEIGPGIEVEEILGQARGIPRDSRCRAASAPDRAPSPRSRPGCRPRRNPWTCS